MIDMNFFDLVKSMRADKSEFQKKMGQRPVAIEGLTSDIPKMALMFNRTDIRKSEIPSANCHGTARGMAKLASIMANKGKRCSQDGNDLMSENTWNEMHEGEKLSTDANMIGLSK